MTRYDGQFKLLEAIEAMDVNRISDAIKVAQDVSKLNPGKIHTEVEKAETAARDAISRLLAAQRELTAAVGCLTVHAHRNRPRASEGCSGDS